MSVSNAEIIAPTRPLPKLNELDTGEFWQATANQRVSLPAVRKLRHYHVASACTLHRLC